MNRTSLYVSLGWLRTVAMVYAGFATSPHLIGSLESALYGIWVFIQDLAAFSDLLYLGVGHYVTRHVARLNALHETKKLRILFSQTLILYTLIGLLAAILLVIIGPFAVARVTTTKNDAGIPLTIGLVGANVTLCFISAACSGLLAGHSKFVALHFMAIVHIAIRTGLILVLFRHGDSLARLAAFVVIAQVAYILGMFLVIYITLPQARPTFVLPTRTYLFDAYSFGVIAFLATIYTKVILLTDTLLVGLFLGAEQLAKFSIPQQMIGYYGVLTVSIVQVLYPTYARLDWDSNRNEIRHLHLKSLSISGVVLGLAAAGVICFATPFITVWIDAEFARFASRIIVPMTLYSLIRALFVQLPVNVLLAHSRAGPVVVWMLGEVLLKSFVSTLTLFWFGLIEMCYATLAVAILFDVTLISRSVKSCLNISFSAMCFSCMPCVLTLALSLLIFEVSQQILGDTSFQLMFLSASVGTICAAIAGGLIYLTVQKLDYSEGRLAGDATVL